MAGLVEKTYGDALFELVLEEKPQQMKDILGELSAVNDVLESVPELIKLSKTPTVSKEEKLGIIESAFKDRLSEYSHNFVMVVTEAGRLDSFGRIFRYFQSRCNEHLGIAEITVVTAEPLSDALRAKLRAKMTSVLGKTVVMKEETDPSIIGGVVIKNGNTTMDGSVRAKLNALRNDIGSVIC